MKLIVFYFSLVQCINVVLGGDILVVEIVPFSSYTNIMNAIVSTLASHHQITFFSVVPKEFDHPNVTYHPLSRPYLHIVSQDDLFTQLAANKRFYVIQETILYTTEEYIENLLKLNKDLRTLVESGKHFDLFFTYTHISEHLIPFSHIFNAALVLVSPAAPLPWHNVAIGNPNFLSYDYTLIVDASNDYFINRIINYVKHLIVTFSYYFFHIPKINNVCQKIYPNGTPHLSDIMNNASLLIVNTHEAMGYSSPSISNSIQIGGIHCRPPKPLPKDLEEFIQGSGEHGIFYFSFGTTILAKVPDEVIEIFINVFRKMPQRVLWKYNNDITNLPKNVKVSKWFPQQDILGHKKVKLFITHGGMLSLQESVYHGVPSLVIPITFDQPNNAHLVEKLEYGRYIDFNEITEERLTSEIHEILTNRQYKEKVEKLSILIKDQPLDPGKRLKWWTDYIIRHKGFPVYRPRDNRYSWIGIIETDILLFFMTVILLFIVTMIFVICTFQRKFGALHRKIKKS